MTSGFWLNGKALEYSLGLPQTFAGRQLPESRAIHSINAWGSLTIQEVSTEDWTLRHFDFFPSEEVSLVSENEEGLQSLVAVNGNFELNFAHAGSIHLREKEFCLLNTSAATSSLSLGRGQRVTICNAIYKPAFYQRFLHLFPLLQGLAQWSKAFFLPLVSRSARFTTHDAIEAIFYDRYLPGLAKTYIHLRLESSFFSMMAGVEEKTLPQPGSPEQIELASAARHMVTSAPRKNFTISQVAAALHCSPSTLKRVFKKVYGSSLHSFAKEYKMLTARERLLGGERLKVVAIDLGFNTLTFPREFKRFFGYTISQMKKGMS